MTTVPVERSERVLDFGVDLDPGIEPVTESALPHAAPTTVVTCPINVRVLPELHQVRLRVVEGEAERSDAARSRAEATVPSPHRPWSGRRVSLSFIAALAVVAVPVFALMSWLWGASNPSSGPTAETVEGLSFLWLLLAVPGAFNVLGALTFRGVSTSREEDGPIPEPVGVPVCFRLVTRGTNVEAVCRSVAALKETMARSPLFPYTVEVVTDHPLPLLHEEGVDVLEVPGSFGTPNGALFKARALAYALEASPVSDTTWLFHLDEETHLTDSVVRGIRDAVVEEERSGELRIGQGAVLYHRDLHRHPFLTLADSIRTGDDLGRFRLQHRFGRTLFGLHGSFILVRNDVEKEVGFDLGPAGSVTEDAWWALVEMAKGRRSRWVDGYCLEQSTRSLSDFVKQRRRWFVGLCLVCRHAPVRFRDRLALGSSVAAWGMAWLGWWGISVAVVTANARVPTVVSIVAAASLAAYAALYLLGLEVNLHQRGLRWHRRLPWHVVQLLLLPAFSLLEAAAVVYGLVRRDVGFHVVKK